MRRIDASVSTPILSLALMVVATGCSKNMPYKYTFAEVAEMNEARYCKDGVYVSLADGEELETYQVDLGEKFRLAMREQGEKLVDLGIKPDNSTLLRDEQVWFCTTVNDRWRLVTVHTLTGHIFVVVNTEWVQKRIAVDGIDSLDVVARHEFTHPAQPFGGFHWLNEATADILAENNDVEPKYLAIHVWRDFFVKGLMLSEDVSREEAELMAYKFVFNEHERDGLTPDFARSILMKLNAPKEDIELLIKLIFTKPAYPGYVWYALVEVLTGPNKDFWEEQLNTTYSDIEAAYLSIKDKVEAQINSKDGQRKVLR